MPFFFAAAIWIVSGAAPIEGIPQSVPVVLPARGHPCVFLTPLDVAAIRAKAETQSWAGAIKTGILEEAGRLLAEPLDIPHEGGQWPHWYTCAEDGAALRGESRVRHVCPQCGKVYSGWPYDQVYVTQRHGHWLQGVRVLGLAYMFAPQSAYAERIRAILLEYASFYGSLPLHDIHNKPDNGARLLSQTLDESVLLCHVVLGYDLVYEDACFSGADHDLIREGFLLSAVKTIQANPRAISNWQSWHNAAVGCTGFLLGSPALAAWAINGEFGFLYQMRRSLLSSGMWFEECPVYHYYALNAHLFLLEAAHRAGVNLYDIPAVKAMFDAPMRQLLPDLTFAPLQDSDRVSIMGQRDFYEVAYARYGDPSYLPLLNNRSGPWALLCGVDTLPALPSVPARPVSSNGAGEGLAVLRGGVDDAVLFLDYGPGRSGHVQPAKLGIVLYAFGDIRFADPGRISYGNRMHKEWFRQTLAHNTIVVDQESQRVTHGELQAFAAGDGYGLCRAVCDSAYKDSPVTLDRCVAMIGGILIDVFRCSAAKESTFDLPLHFVGGFEVPDTAEPVEPLGGEHGYQHLRNLRRCLDPLRELTIDAGAGNAISVHFFGEQTCFVAEGYGEHLQSFWPVVIRRVRGKTACFAAVYQLLNPGESAVRVDADLGRKTRVRAGDAQLIVDKRTRLTISGKPCPLDQGS